MDLEDLQEAFSLFDKDGDGLITSSELFTVMQSLGQTVTDSETEQMIQKVDQDGNGLIDFDEFLRMMETFASQRGDSNDLQDLFRALDKDHSGFIDRHELKTTMNEVGMNLSDKDVDSMMKAAGLAIKDRIFYEDFVQMMSGKIGKAQQSRSIRRQSESDDMKRMPSLESVKGDPELQGLRVAFSMFDKDGDGQITVQEVYDTMKSLHLKVDRLEVKQMVKRVDTDGNGTISFDEFCQLMQRYKQKDVTDDVTAADVDLRDTFKIFDKDKDGFLNANDLRETMKELGITLTEQDLHAMMRSVKVGPHGKITYSDFCKIFAANGDMFSGALKEASSSDKLSKAQESELKAVFSVFDKDHDGFITMSEVMQVLTSMGVDPCEKFIKDIFQQVDLDGNDKIDFKEFLILVRKYERPLPSDREMREMFNMIDSDRSGFIDVAELKKCFATLGLPLSNSDVKQMIRQANITGNRIFYEDFVHIITTHLGQTESKASVYNSSAATNGSSTSLSTSPNPQLKELYIQFAQFDKDGDGSITKDELTQVMTATGITADPKEIERIVDRVDLDKNGRIEFDEFSKVMLQYQRTLQHSSSVRDEEETRQAFKAFDKNSDGFIDERELQVTMQELGMTLQPEDIKAMMKKAGCKISGRIYYEEFVRLMSQDLLKTSSSSSTDAQPPVSDSVFQDLKVAFSMFDKNSDGMITSSELLSVMKGLGFKMDDAQAKELIHRFDIDGNGTLEFDEFQTMMRSKMTDSCSVWERTKKVARTPDTWEAFRVFDRNSDGYVSKSELYLTMKDLGVELSAGDLDEMMKEADVNQDGRIDYSEFSKLMKGAFEGFAKQAAQMIHEKSLYKALMSRDLSVEQMQTAFKQVDRNSDGQINSSELEEAASRLGIPINTPQADTVINHYGNKETKMISLNEFLVMMAKNQSQEKKRRTTIGEKKAEEEEMRTAFKVFDIDGNGVIDEHELMVTMQNLGEKLSDSDIRAMIRHADKNGDGKIDYEEFIQMMYAK